MTGDIFKGHLIDAMFNLTSVMTGQTIHLCGMLTEAIHTPFLGDRALSLENARYVMKTARHFGDEITVKPGGSDRAARAATVLSRLRGVARTRRAMGLMARDRSRSLCRRQAVARRRTRVRRRLRTRTRLLEPVRGRAAAPRRAGAG